MAPGTEPITAAARRRAVVVAGHAGKEPAARAALDDPSPVVRGSALGALARMGALEVQRRQRRAGRPGSSSPPAGVRAGRSPGAASLLHGRRPGRPAGARLGRRGAVRGRIGLLRPGRGGWPGPARHRCRRPQYRGDGSP